MRKVLVLCTSNSCRSQIAEGYLNFYASESILVKSAGIKRHFVHPLAIQVMEEDGIDISSSTSKDFTSFEGVQFDYVLMVCNEVASELPTSISADRFISFDIPDPAAFQGSPFEQLEEFRRVREIIKKRILKFIGKELIYENVPVALS